MTTDVRNVVGEYKYGFHDDVEAVFKAEKGLNAKVVESISKMKDEPQWMTDFRLRAYDIFQKKELPRWADNGLELIDFQDIHYYVRAAEGNVRDWDDVPEYIKNRSEERRVGKECRSRWS